MFTIYADGECIYNDVNNLQELRVVSPELELSDNAAGTLTMTLPPSNVGYGLIQCLSTVITVKRDGKEIWSGRAVSEKMDFWKNRALTCEGELGYLNDSLQPQREFENPTPRSFLNEIIAVHNTKVSADKRFTVGVVTVTDSMKNEDSEQDEYYNDIYVYTNFDTTMSCIQEKLVGNLGGHIRIRKENGVRYIDYLKDYPKTNSQVIEFGNNLMDFVVNYDETDFCTVLIPLGERYDEGEIDGLEGYLDISDVNSGKNYLTNDSALQSFGWIERVEHFDDISEEDELLAKGREFLSDIQFGTMELEVNAVDLNYLKADAEAIELLDEIRVKSRPHGLDRMFPVTKLKIPIDHPADSTFTMGTKTVGSFTARSNEANRKVLDVIGSLPSKKSILEDAKNNAADLIRAASNGYVTITRDEQGTEAIYISNERDYKKATKVWVWNLNGLGYFPNGINGGSVNVAITMDGTIVADFLKAGVLSDGAGKNSWNLSDGTLNLQGVFTNGSDEGSKIRLTGGAITGYWNGAERGKIIMDGTFTDGNSHAQYAGIKLKTDVIALDSKQLWVRDSDSGSELFSNTYTTDDEENFVINFEASRTVTEISAITNITPIWKTLHNVETIENGVVTKWDTLNVVGGWSKDETTWEKVLTDYTNTWTYRNVKFLHGLRIK